MDSKYILETEHVSKGFGSLEVLKDINLKVKKGEGYLYYQSFRSR